MTCFQVTSEVPDTFAVRRIYFFFIVFVFDLDFG